MKTGAAMRYALWTLRRNLAAGARLALFRPVPITSFRITLAAALGLLVSSASASIPTKTW